MASPSARARPYVLAWRLEGRKVVVVGAGSIGEGKIETLLSSAADLRVFDPTPSARVKELGAQGKLQLHERRLCPFDLAGAAMVVAATGEHEMNARIAQWAKRFRVVVNAVDDPSLCEVTVPAVVNRGPATIAITTNGATPAGARFLREEITRLVPEDVSLMLQHAAGAREELRENGDYRYDYPAWRQRYFEPAWQAAHRRAPAAIEEARRRFVASFATARTPLRAGRVSLVGAGPGGADLITLRGAQALAAADVVLYDRLADPELLDLAPPAAVRIPVGKGKGFGMSQEDINDLIIEHARTGSHVVRLKGGDPFVFGRGQEEYDVAKAVGLEVEVVPGLSSALAGPALAGVSVTDRRYSSGFTVVSGHRASLDSYDWDALVRSGLTLVVLMAASTAQDVARQLLAAGHPSNAPVAFVHRAGTPHERTEHRLVADVAHDGCPTESPTVMVVGQSSKVAWGQCGAPSAAALATMASSTR